MQFGRFGAPFRQMQMHCSLLSFVLHPYDAQLRESGVDAGFKHSAPKVPRKRGRHTDVASGGGRTIRWQEEPPRPSADLC